MLFVVHNGVAGLKLDSWSGEGHCWLTLASMVCFFLLAYLIPLATMNTVFTAPCFISLCLISTANVDFACWCTGLQTSVLGKL
jgi:hypothetical protein